MFSTIFSYGFRPFFFGATLFATLIIPLWVASFTGAISLVLPSPVSSWHAHEMIFGFVAAAACGFILTAMPNWTRTKPLQGGWLAALFLLWLAGRIAMLFYFVLPVGLSAVIDIAFLVALTGFVARQLIVSGNYKNLIICAIFASLTVANILMHLEFSGLLDWGALTGQRLAVDTVLLLIVVLGGRVVPAFTRNWLNANGHQVSMEAGGLVDKISILSVVALLLANIIVPNSMLVFGIATFAALANFYRLSRWHGVKTLSNSLLWVLHLAYLWLCVSLLLKGAMVFSMVIPESLNIHAAGIGAAGTMIGAILTRASLGHTGRALKTPNGVALGYVLVSLAAIFRISTEICEWVDRSYLLNAAGLFWVLGFGIITVVYIPILLGPMKRPGSD